MHSTFGFFYIERRRHRNRDTELRLGVACRDSRGERALYG